jgi:type IV pilus assembly protein PilE
MTTPCIIPPTPPRGRRGFTLIELMITVAIVSILAMVAVPAYFEQVRKSRRADAVSVLNQVVQAQERWRANNASYTDVLGTAGLNVNSAAASATTYTVPSGYYTVQVTGFGATSYTVQATAAGAQLKDTKCATFTIAASGGQFTYSATPAANSARCWSR